MTLQVKNKADGKVYPIHKYILSSDGIESVWCNDWYGHHRIGFDCEWATHHRAKVLVDALEWIKTYGPADELTVTFIEKQLEQWKSGKGKEQPAKPIEYMPVHPEDARKFDCPKQFPMHLLNEDQAMSNHGQTLKRLKERGGLSVHEILAIVDRKPWNHYGAMSWTEAIKKLNDIVINNPQQSK